jgi:hypothetical protein
MIELEPGVISKLESYRGTLAYLAVRVRGECEGTTPFFAEVVNCQTAVMREGLEELSRLFPEVVKKASSTKWVVGSGKAAEEGVQILDSAAGRRKDFLDDLKAIWEWGNKVPFTMNAADGAAVARWLKQNKEWSREQWRQALRNRFLSEGIVKSQPVYLWLARLVEYVEAPLDRYGKVMLHGGGKLEQAVNTEIGNRAAREAAVAAAGSHA